MAMTEARRGRWQQQQHYQLQPQGWQQKQRQSCHNQYQRYQPKKYRCRPPCAPGSTDPCCQSVPLWEKKFCTDECGIPWWKICETKKVAASMYSKVMEWDDSAGEEAISAARSCYWAKINGLPCDDVRLPDPDMYIDVVDHEARGDPELAEDFHKPSAVTDDEASDDMSSEMHPICNYADMPIPVSGWGDEDDPIPVPVVSGWGDGAEASSPVVAGWGDALGPTPPGATGWCDAQYYSIPVSGWGDAESPVLPTNGCGDRHDAVHVVGGWDGSKGSRKDQPWKQPKSNDRGRGRRHDRKRTDGCHQFGKQIWLPKGSKLHGQQQD